MIGEAPGPINFTMFLTLFGEKLTGTDPEEVIRNAFQCFDEDGTGKKYFSKNFYQYRGVTSQVPQKTISKMSIKHYTVFVDLP